MGCLMRCKIIDLLLGLFHKLLGLSLVLLVSEAVGDYGHKKCEDTVKKWASSSAYSKVSWDQHTLRDLLLFLHVPRTGGRTYYHCFLKKLYAQSLECPLSYEKLNYDSRKSDCRLLTTHDDYSVMSKLPRERTSVMTVLRDPIQRVFSSYDFSVEVASRYLVHPNLTTVERMFQGLRHKTPTVGVLAIWPWKYLVPWMLKDLFARRDARKLRGQVHLVNNDMYDTEDFVMPLREYINDPITRDIVHNGATFQIAGLTNNSYFAGAREVRHCVLEYHSLGEYVLEVAKKRLDNMLYVGLTENHKESANVFANVVAAQVISELKRFDDTGNDNSERGSLHINSDTNDKDDNAHQNPKNVTLIREDKAVEKNWTVGAVMEAYNSCISSLRSVHRDLSVRSLRYNSPANFSDEELLGYFRGRREVPEALVQEIALLNSLDVELYKYGQHIFEKQVADMRLKTVNDKWTYSHECLSVSIIALMLLILILLFLNSRKTTSKVKL